MAKGYRMDRLGEEIRKIISAMLLTDIKDPRLAGKMISVTGVDVTSDGSYATCYVSVLPGSGSSLQGADSQELENEKVLEGLKSASGIIRKEVSRKVKIRHTPELLFKIDSSLLYGRHIDNVIKDLDIVPEIGTDSSLEEIAEALMKGNRIVLYPHVNMDGDALGSSVALAYALRYLGKECKIFVSEDIPLNLVFLCEDGGEDLITNDHEYACSADISVMIDNGEFKRIPEREDAFQSARLTICLDHHGTTNPICNMNYIDPDEAATGQIIFYLLDELMGEDLDAATDSELDAATDSEADGIPKDIFKKIGEALFTAITTDTGDFQYSNTQKESHEIVAELYDWGIDHNWVSRKIYNNVRPQRINLTARVLSDMEVFCDGKAAMACVTQDTLRETGAKMEETEWIINELRSIAGVEVAIVLKEEADSVVKCSLRSEEYVDVAALAKEFDGGGHIRASGYTDYCSLSEAAERIKAAVAKVI